jgi:hypothetical protein
MAALDEKSRACPQTGNHLALLGCAQPQGREVGEQGRRLNVKSEWAIGFPPFSFFTPFLSILPFFEWSTGVAHPTKMLLLKSLEYKETLGNAGNCTGVQK